MPKLSKKLPDRVTNEKAKAKRSRSWNRNALDKMGRIAAQTKREKVNAERGFTGNQLDKAMRRYAKLHGVSYRGIKNSVKMGLQTELQMAAAVHLI